MKQNEGSLRVNVRSAVLFVMRASIVGRSELLNLRRVCTVNGVVVVPPARVPDSDLRVLTGFRTYHVVVHDQITFLLFLKK